MAPGSLTPAAIDKELTRLDQEFRELLQYAADNGGYKECAEQFKAISEQMGALREQKALILEAQQADLVCKRPDSAGRGTVEFGITGDLRMG